MQPRPPRSLARLTPFPIMSTTRVPSEESQLAILDSDASLHDKALACHRLVYVAGPESVPALAALLDDDVLSDYARSGLEAIEDAAASQALIDALPKLTGRLLAGVVNSLGVRREKTAVATLQKLAADTASGVQAEALASLGLIATPAASDTLREVMSKGADDLKTAAGHASLVAIEHLRRDGDSGTASELLKSLTAAFPEGPIHDASKALTNS